MGMGSSFSVCIHILTLLAHTKEEFISSEFIARSININPVMVRREISKLKRFGLVESKEGKSGGVKLNRASDKITLKEIMMAVNDSGQHLIPKYKNEPNPRCPIGNQIEGELEDLFSRVDDSVYSALERMTIAEFHAKFELI